MADDTTKKPSTANDGKKKTGNPDKFMWKPEDLQWEDPDVQDAWDKVSKGGSSDENDKNKKPTKKS